jgi:hypothetical protein
MDDADQQFLAKEERLFWVWRLAEDAASAAEEATRLTMERHQNAGGPELTTEEFCEVVRLRATASKAALELLIHTRSRPI